MVHLVPAAWNGPVKADEPVRVLAFTNLPQVELVLNGRSLGKRNVTRGSFAEWSVPFPPGRLTARSLAGGQVMASDEVATTGRPARIQLTAARRTLQPGAEDAVVAAVAICDEEGRVVPDAANRVQFKLTGSGRILGVANGNPADHDPDRAEQRATFKGRCIAVLEAGRASGTLVPTARSPGLAPAEVDLEVR